MAELGGDGSVSVFKKPDQPISPEHMSNQVYFNFVPLNLDESKIKPLFEPFGNVSGFIMKKSDKGQYGYVTYSDPQGTNKEYGPKAANECVEKLNGHVFEGE